MTEKKNPRNLPALSNKTSLQKQETNPPASSSPALPSSSPIGRAIGRWHQQGITKSLKVQTDLVRANEQLLSAQRDLDTLKHSLHYLDADLAHERQLKEAQQAVELAEAEVRKKDAEAKRQQAAAIAENNAQAALESSKNSKLHRQAFADEREHLNKQLKALRDRADFETPGSVEFANYQAQIAETMKRVKELERDTAEAQATTQGFLDAAGQAQQHAAYLDLAAMLHQTLQDEGRAAPNADEQTLLFVFTGLKQYGLEQATNPPTNVPAWREYLTKRQAELTAPWFTAEHLAQCLLVLDRWE